MNVLEAKKLTKIYEGRGQGLSTQALRGVNLTIQKGEMVGVMGPSGSGKTTLLNLLSGIDKPTSGIVSIANNQITSLKKDEMALFRRQKIGFVFQEFNLLDSLTIQENIMLPMILDKKDGSEMKRVVKDIMNLLGILELANKYPYTISGGQQQRVSIARAISNNPDIVFADEPTGNLDSKSSNKVMKSFETMNTEKQVTILMVTHDAFAASFCKRIVFIKDGEIHSEIVRKGSKKEFFEHILDCLALMGGENSDI